MLLEKMLADDGADVVQAVLDRARDGDMAAARLVLDRIVPVRKGRPVAIELPKITAPTDVLTAMSAVIEQMADGEITPDEAMTIAGVLNAKRQAVELIDIEARLARIERYNGGRRLVFAWRELGETTEAAIERLFGKDADLGDVEILIFSWQRPA